ncbi:MAG: pentapeptide repeat-containing protein, partial [Rhodobacteraceae bacterium]|nr:pentapeptide repeat-containing protein [Paracoccaceae bacterium]
MSDRFTHFLAGFLGVFALCSLSTGALAGSDEEKMADIKKNGGCPRCDLRLTELRFLTVENVNFNRANLRETDLKEAVLPGGDFQN